MKRGRDGVILWVTTIGSITLFLGGAALGMWISGSFMVLVLLLLVPVVVVLGVTAVRIGFKAGSEAARGVEALRQKGSQNHTLNEDKRDQS